MRLEEALKQAVKNQQPSFKVGDIVQVTAKPHKHMASIWIVHTIEGHELVCYQPQKGRPQKFKVPSRDVTVVGHARLLYGKPLADDDVYSTSLDKI